MKLIYLSLALALSVLVLLDVLLGILGGAFASWPKDVVIRHIVIDPVLLAFAWKSYDNYLHSRKVS